MSAKNIIVKPISSQDANRICRRLHYSGKVVPNSQIHFGVFIGNKCCGVMQFGPPMVKRNSIGLVADTKWHDFLELNRMAFGPELPRNSESRAISVAMRMLKKAYPNLQWVLSFADGTQCGDGTIYRASGFVLTGIKKNSQIVKLKTGEIVAAITYGKGKHILETGGRSAALDGAEKMPGFMLRYIYFLDPTVKQRLTVPILPFSDIKKLGAEMYLGKKRVVSIDNDVTGHHPVEGGVNPTTTLQNLEVTNGDQQSSV